MLWLVVGFFCIILIVGLWGLVGSEVRERKGIVVVDIILCVRYVFLGYEYIDGLYFVLSFKVF